MSSWSPRPPADSPPRRSGGPLLIAGGVLIAGGCMVLVAFGVLLYELAALSAGLAGMGLTSDTHPAVAVPLGVVGGAVVVLGLVLIVLGGLVRAGRL